MYCARFSEWLVKYQKVCTFKSLTGVLDKNIISMCVVSQLMNKQ